VPAELSLAGRVAIVTGASRGIGRATALALAEAGAAVALAARDGEALERAAREVAAGGRRSIAVPGDVADPESASRLVESCVRELGPPDIAVANAGAFQDWGPMEELELGEWQRILAVDLTGTMLTCRAAARAMMATERGGAIVIVSSIAGLVAMPGAAAYAAAKAGVIGLTQTLAAEWAPRGIRVNALAPGFIRREQDPWASRPQTLADITARTPLGRRGEPREVALAALFLASPAAAFITGATLPVDGGWTLG